MAIYTGSTLAKDRRALASDRRHPTDRRHTAPDRRRKAGDDHSSSASAAKPDAPTPERHSLLDLPLPATIVTQAVNEFRAWIDNLFHMEGSAVPSHRTPLSSTSRVYVLVRNQEILDVFDAPKKAFATAEELQKSSGRDWVNSRPGRWYSGTDQMEVQEWQPK